MSKISDAIFARALDAALHEVPRRDLAVELMASLQGARQSRALAGLFAMAAISGGQVYGRAHLTRLRAEYMNKEIEQ